jgi:hypothetical protein
MTDDVQASGGSFAEMDPRLTVFALANGVDLSKREGYRRLEWFSDGFEVRDRRRDRSDARR